MSTPAAAVHVIAHPRGAQFLDRDAANVARWFTARGLAGAAPAPGELAALLRQEPPRPSPAAGPDIPPEDYRLIRRPRA